nr:MAG TPA: Head Tail Connector Protein [Caudoviricetes sp.]
MYACFDYYYDVYGGRAIEADDFCRLSVRASSFIDYCTMGRAKNHADMDEVKMCCCALAEQYGLIESAQTLAQKSTASAAASDSGEVQSESVGGWSRSFRSGGDSASAALKSAESAKAALMSTVTEYLANTGLLRARGYGPCPCSHTL